MKQGKKKQNQISLPVFILLGIVLFGIIKFWQIAVCILIVGIIIFTLLMIYRPDFRAKVILKIKQLKEKI
jgi:hypothetical protein